jgi:hypothetical protein
VAVHQSEHNGHHLTFIDDTIRHKYIFNGEPVPGTTTFCKGGYPTSENLTSWMVGQATKYGVEKAWALGLAGTKVTATAVKELVKESKKKPMELAKAAAAIGTVVHDYAYHLEKGNAQESARILKEAEAHPDWLKIKNGIEKFLEWKEKNRDEIIASEEIVALPCNNHGEDVDENRLCHCYAGKFDRLARRGGRIILSDFKTSSGVYVDQFIQLGGYTPAIEYWMPDKLDNQPIGGLEILRFGKEDGEFEAMLIKDEAEIKAFVRQALYCRATFAFRKRWENDKRFKFMGKVAS